MHTPAEPSPALSPKGELAFARVRDLPEFATVAQVAPVLQVSDRVLYEACREYEATHGVAGIPCVRIGKRVLRIPRAALERMVEGHAPNGNGRDNGAATDNGPVINIDHEVRARDLGN